MTLALCLPGLAIVALLVAGWWRRRRLARLERRAVRVVRGRAGDVMHPPSRLYP